MEGYIKVASKAALPCPRCCGQRIVPEACQGESQGVCCPTVSIPWHNSPCIGEDPVEPGLGPAAFLDDKSVLEVMEPLGVFGVSTHQPDLEEGAPGIHQGRLPPIVHLEWQSKRGRPLSAGLVNRRLHLQNSLKVTSDVG